MAGSNVDPLSAPPPAPGVAVDAEGPAAATAVTAAVVPGAEEEMLLDIPS